MTKISGADSGLAIFNRVPASVHLAALCPSVQMMDGIKYVKKIDAIIYYMSICSINYEYFIKVQVNLCDFTRRAYGTSYVEATRIQIHANCRLRRVKTFKKGNYIIVIS